MRRIAVLLVALTAIVLNDVSATAQPSDFVQRGPDKKGVVLDGLTKSAADSACKGQYELKHKDKVGGVERPLCTHGPDPAPEGVDVHERRLPEPEVTADVLPTGGVASATSGIQCYGTGSDGYRVQLIYARASNVADRFATYAGSFLQWAANVDLMVDASAAETGGSRHVRFLTDSSCNLIVDRVTLSTTGDDNFSNTISELRAKGYTRSDRKYLVWVDANVYCGIAQVYYDDRADPVPGRNYNNGHTQVQGTVARVDNGCWGHANSVEAHELMHNLGGVQTSAPNATANSHCRDDYDRMCYVDAAGVSMVYRCASTHENRFDCNHDDYFSTNPPTGTYLATHWNTANNAFLATGPGAVPPSPTPTTTTTTVAPTTTTTRPPTTTTTVPPTTTKPSAPRSLVVTTVGGGRVNLAWQPPTTGPVTGYKIYRGSGFGNPTLVATIGNVTNYADFNVPLGYASYYVTAYNSAGEGAATPRSWVFVR